MIGLAIKKRRMLLGVALFLYGAFGMGAPVFGAEFSVIDAALHSDAPSAEICLMFNAVVDFPSRDALAAAIVLKKDGKKHKVDPKALSLTNVELCVQGLERRAVYFMMLPDLKNASGKRIGKTTSFTFSIPDRKSALGFVSAATLNAFPLYGNSVSEFTPVLRSVNVQKTRLTLYKLERRETFAVAWQRFVQSALAQSESLIYARENGKVVFESDLVFAGTPNQPQVLPAPLPARDSLAPGLYYLAAVPQADAAQDPGLLAGQWFLVSNMRLGARRETDGVRVVVRGVNDKKGRARTTVFLMNDKGSVFAKAQTAQDGTAFLSVPEESKKEVLYALAQDASGNMDVFGLSDKATFANPPSAFVMLDRETYKAGETAFVAFGADKSVFKDEKGRGEVRLLRPDGSVYATYPVPDFKDAEVLPVDLPQTRSQGLWHLSWRGKDNAVLGETSFRYLHENGTVVMDVEPVRKRIGGDGKLDLIVRTTAPFKKGKVVVRPARPENTTWQDSAWQEYVLGLPIEDPPAVLAEATFMTGREGDGAVDLECDMKKISSPPQSFEVLVSLDGVAEKKRLVLAPREAPPLIGIKSLPREAFLPGSQQAAFAVIALDSQGKRVAQSNLHYTVLEEGRSFAWTPLEEGYWNAKPLPHRRRVGGGRLDLSAHGDDTIVWSVTPGRYSLEISDNTGKLLARYAFDGKQEDAQSVLANANLFETTGKTNTPEIVPSDPKKTYVAGKKILFPVRVKGIETGKRSGVIVTARFLPDDERAPVPKPKIVHAALDAKGMAQVPLDLPFFDGTAQITTMVWSAGKGVARPSAFLVHAPFSVMTFVPDTLNVGDKADVRVSMQLNEGAEGTYACVAESSGGIDVQNGRETRARLKKGERKTLTLSFVARSFGQEHVTFVCKAPDGGQTRVTRSVFVQAPSRERGIFVTQEMKQEETIVFTEKNHENGRGIFIAALDLPDPVPVLESFMKELPLTTIEIARWIEASFLWEKSIDALGLARVDRIEALRALRNSQLALRQKDEGCLTVFDDEGPCDIASTAQAVSILRSGPVWSAAAEWLKRKLQNTWIDEAERDARALAFEALARSKEADPSALRYFAQTSEDKAISAHAQAALSLALAMGAKDQPLSRQWAERARIGTNPLSLETLAMLAANENVSSNVLNDLLLRSGFSAPETSEKDGASWLVVFANAALKAKPWKIRINNGDANKESEKTIDGFFAARIDGDGKNGGIKRIENLSGHPLFLSQESAEKTTEKDKTPLRFALYKLDGSPVGTGDSLEFRRTYLMRMDIEAPSVPSFLVFPKRAAFDVIPLEPGASVMRAYPWIDAPLSRVSWIVRAPWSNAVSLNDAPPAGASWHIAVLVTPKQRGNFSLPAPLWKDATGQQKPLFFSMTRKTVF